MIVVKDDCAAVSSDCNGSDDVEGARVSLMSLWEVVKRLLVSVVRAGAVTYSGKTKCWWLPYTEV